MISIILVEDDSSKADKVKSAVADNFENITIIHFEDLISAKRDLTLNKYDLLILDMQIPIRKGEEPIKDSGLNLINDLDISSRYLKPSHIIGLTAYEEFREEFMTRWICIKYDSTSTKWIESLCKKINYIIECKKNNSNNNLSDRAKQIKCLIETGEDKFIEFKETLQVPVFSKNDLIVLQKSNNLLGKFNTEGNIIAANEIKENINKLKNKTNDISIQRIVLFSAIKELAAFANSEGGTLIIGVNDNKVIVGISSDLLFFGDKDNMRLKFDESIKNYINDSFHEFINHEYIDIDGQELFIINVKKSKKTPVFLNFDENKNQSQIFYIRRQGSASKLEGVILIDYITEHFDK